MLELTAQQILEFVVSAVITMGVENLPAATKKLWSTIRNRLQSQPVAVTAIEGIEENQSQNEIPKLTSFLDVEMLSDETFKQEVHQLAEVAMNQDRDIIKQTVITPQSSPVVGKQEGTNNQIIGTQVNLGKE